MQRTFETAVHKAAIPILQLFLPCRPPLHTDEGWDGISIRTVQSRARLPCLVVSLLCLEVCKALGQPCMDLTTLCWDSLGARSSRLKTQVTGFLPSRGAAEGEARDITDKLDCTVQASGLWCPA